VSVEDFRKKGYSPEAIVNFIALLGWNPKTEQEIFTMEELIDQFDLSKMNRAGGVFDLDRLDWISAQHIKKMNADELYKQVAPFLTEKEFFIGAKKERKTEEYVKKVLFIEKERLSKFTEVGEGNIFFFSDNLNYSKDDIRWKKNSDEETKNNLEKSLKVLENISDWKKEKIEEQLLKEAGDKRGDLLFPLRWVLTGQKFSPTPFEVAWVLGKEESLMRVKNSLKLFA
jgi:glutamyl/glutaminyl-tRNA synthetase